MDVSSVCMRQLVVEGYGTRFVDYTRRARERVHSATAHFILDVFDRKRQGHIAIALPWQHLYASSGAVRFAVYAAFTAIVTQNTRV